MKWLAVVATIFLSGVCTSSPVKHDVGPKECAEGPEYWCKDIQTAKSCGAVKHCIQEVWQNVKLPKDESELCDTCKKMVAEARDQLQSNETQEELREVFEGTCKIYFPIKLLSDECIKYVDQFIPQLVEFLLSRMDPQTVCATAGLCNAAEFQAKFFVRRTGLNMGSQATCQDCKKFGKDVVDMLHSQTKEQVEEKILTICDQIHSHSDMCREIVANYFNQIYDVLMNELNPDALCQLLGMCDETNNKPEVKMTSVIELFERQRIGDDLECEFCQAVIQHFKDEVTANTTKEELKTVFLALCSQMGSFAERCKDVVNDDFDEIYNFLINELDPKVICVAVGLCTGKSIKSQAQYVPMMKLVPAISAYELPLVQLESNDVNQAPHASKETLVKSVRVKLPFSRPAQRLSPAYRPLPTTRQDLQSLKRLKSKPVCALCEYALHELQNILNENKTEEAIKKAVERVCDVLPQTLDDQCKAFIEDYGDTLIVLLEQELDPSIICVELKLCGNTTKGINVMTKFPSSKSSFEAAPLRPSLSQLPPERLMPMTLVAPLAKQKSDQLCQMCEFIMGMLKTMLSDNKTKEAIEHALDQVCNALPTEYQSECKTFVDQYAEQLIDLLQKEDPLTICTLLGVCQQMKPAKPVTPIKELKMDECDTCQIIVDYIDKFLEDPDVDADIAHVVEKVCYVVPKSLRAKCESYIETYGPYIMQMLSALMDSKTVCQAIDLCSHVNGQVQLLGGKKCTFGPAYWCQSQAHARSCNAEEHCQKFAWKN